MSFEAHYLRLVSGEACGMGPSLLRAGLALAAPIYGAAVAARSRLYRHGWTRSEALPRPTISVGNLTVGGTGKTPVVAWLANELRKRSLRPAILMRGYKAAPGQRGDEQLLLEQLLGEVVPVEADPQRNIGAQRVLQRSEVDVFLLDDGFQHRSVRREVDLVLIDATRPFGYGHLLPRGLLREPLSGLSRATAVLLTRVDLVEPTRLAEIQVQVRQHTTAPMFACALPVDRVVSVAGGTGGVHPRTFLAVSGIGNPTAFEQSLRRIGCEIRETLALGDHHAYAPHDVRAILQAMRRSGAEAIITTGKDWVKLSTLWPPEAPPVQVAQQRVVFERDAERELLELVLSRLPNVR